MERKDGQPPEPRRICRRFLRIGECCSPTTYRAEDKESGEAVRPRVLTRFRITPVRIPVSLDSGVCLFFQLDGSILCTLKLFSMLQASG
ncbi:putative transcription factor C3H family [Helianthus anomalus]